MSQPRSKSPLRGSFPPRSLFQPRSSFLLRSLSQPSQPRSSFPSRSRAVVVAVALGFLVTGCQGDASPPDPTAGETSVSAPEPSVSASPTPTISPTEPAAPEPTAASSDGPAANIPVPEKPALADENSVEGLEAFTEYWFELLNYAYITNDWTPLEAVTDPGCDTCSTIRSSVEDVYADGQWIAGAEIDLLTFASEFEVNTAGSVNSFVENQQAEIIYFESDGTRLGSDPPQPEPSVDVVIAVWDESSWFLLDYGRPEGT